MLRCASNFCRPLPRTEDDFSPLPILHSLFLSNPFLSVLFCCALFIYSRSKVSLPSSTLPLHFDSSSSFCFLFHIFIFCFETGLGIPTEYVYSKDMIYMIQGFNKQN